jgi:hypothetical protein
MSWVAREARRQAEYDGPLGPEMIQCQWCGRPEVWADWWSASGPEGPLRCPHCDEPKETDLD